MAQIATKFIQDQAITNAKVNNSAAIAYSKLNLSGSIVNADINASAGIVYSKLSLTGSIVNADISASAAIVYSKLSLSNSIVNADINSAAAIAYSKLNLAASVQASDMNSGAATNGQVLTANGSGGATYATPASTTVTVISTLFTLSGTDITNQYIDLGHVAQGASASTNSVLFLPANGPAGLKGADYTVSLTGGSGGVTRLTFAGDFATGGASALVAGDNVQIYYAF